MKPVFFLPEEFRDEPDAPAKVEIGEDNDFMAAATLTQVLWAAGRVSAGLIAAREFLESFRYQEIAVADFVRFSVQEAYYNSLLATEMVRIAEKAMQETKEAVRVARAGFEQGTVSRFDVMRAEVELANRRAPLVTARNGLDQSLIVHRRRCGLDPERAIILADSLEVDSRPSDLDMMISVMNKRSAKSRL